MCQNDESGFDSGKRLFLDDAYFMPNQLKSLQFMTSGANKDFLLFEGQFKCR